MQQRLNAQWEELNTGNLPSGGTSAVDSSSARASQEAATAMLFEGLNRTSFTAAPSLQSIRSQFENRRADSTEKMLELLAQVYPNMTVAEARRLVTML